MADFLVVQDLINRAGGDRVNKYFDDDGDGIVLPTDPNVLAVLAEAEGEAYSRMLRAYGDKAAIALLAQNDAVFLGHCAWVALEIASERRPEYTDTDGKGAHWQPYVRALAYFDNLSKARVRSPGESAAGRMATAGGSGGAQPRPPAHTFHQFEFAPSKKAPRGHGGF